METQEDHLDDSQEIIDLLERLAIRLDLLEDKLDRVADATSELQTQGALMGDDLNEIRRDIDKLEPGII